MHALSSRGRRAASVSVRTQNQLNQASKPVLEALEPRQLLSAGSQIGSTTANDLGANERGAFVVRLADQSLIQVGSTGVCGFGMQLALVNYNSAGVTQSSQSIDLPTGLTTTGYSWCSINAVTVVDNKIIVAGSVNHEITESQIDQDLVVARLSLAGVFDNSFSGDGVVTSNFTPVGAPSDSTDEAFAVGVDNNGKIAVGAKDAGTTGFSYVVARYTSAGVLDNTFGAPIPASVNRTGFARAHFNVAPISGNPSFDLLTSLAIQSDNKILLGGSTQLATDIAPGFLPPAFGIQRYSNLGELDSSFGGGDGLVVTPIPEGAQIMALAVASDGNILAAGYADSDPSFGFTPTFAIARYDTFGNPDTSFGVSGLNVLPPLQPVNTTDLIIDGELTDVEIQADGGGDRWENLFLECGVGYSILRYGLDGSSGQYPQHAWREGVRLGGSDSSQFC